MVVYAEQYANLTWQSPSGLGTMKFKMFNYIFKIVLQSRWSGKICKENN